MSGSEDPMTLRKKLLWISILYFAEGLPFGIVYDVLPVYFRQSGVGLKEIGFMFFLVLPWTLKVFWSPLVDRFGQRRAWVTLCCSVMAAVMLAIPLLPASEPTLLLYLVLLAFTLASATQDIAIDAYAIGILSKGEEGVGNGYRLALYRVAVLLGGGGTMWLVKPLGWTWIFLILAIAFVALALAAWASPPVTVVHQPPREWARSFWTFLSRPGSIAIFAFILTYRIGELLMMPMVKPFWVDRGMTPEEIGKISTIAGTILGIFGTFVGGLFTTRFGLFRGLWILGLIQAVPNLAYAAVAQFSLGWPYLYGASMFESFGFGLATGAFFAFLMRICDKRQAATQYAFLSSVVGLSRFFGGWSGVGVERLGYAGFFGLTFVLSLPCYALLPWVRQWCANGDRPGSGVLAGSAAAADPASAHAAENPSATGTGSSTSGPAPASVPAR